MEIIMTEMLWAVVLLVVGFVLLIKGADFFVEGSSSVAKMLKVPSIIIGLTIVAMGTSLPECAVSITASVTNNNALAVSNAIGSNIFNLMVVCGFCALFNPLYVEKSTLKKEFPFSVVCAVLLLVCGYLGMQLGRADGIILLIVFVAFLVWGTSLPELVTSVVAARKNELDMALGNVIGSNIFNILFVLGIAATISPITFIMENVIDIVILVAMSVLVWALAWTKKKLDRFEGIVMLALYVVYLVYICMR